MERGKLQQEIYARKEVFIDSWFQSLDSFFAFRPTWRVMAERHGRDMMVSLQGGQVGGAGDKTHPLQA